MGNFNEKYFKTEGAVRQDVNAIDSVLAEGEEILWRTKPKKSAFIWGKIMQMLPIVLLWVCFDGFFIGILIGTVKEIPTGLIIFLCVFFAFHLAPLWIWLTNVLTAGRRVKNTEYAFTDKRIIIRSGLIGIDIANIYYSDIQSVNVRVGLIDRILKVGDIYISGSFKAQVLSDIADPYRVTSELQTIIHDIKADILYPNALRPEENPGYHTKYRP